MNGFTPEMEEQLTISEKALLADQENIAQWVESLYAEHLHAALIERLQETNVILEESEMSAILREICARLLMLEEIEKEIGNIKKLIDRKTN
jgi:hypothetical protein